MMAPTGIMGPPIYQQPDPKPTFWDFLFGAIKPKGGQTNGTPQVKTDYTPYIVALIVVAMIGVLVFAVKK